MYKFYIIRRLPACKGCIRYNYIKKFPISRQLTYYTHIPLMGAQNQIWGWGVGKILGNVQGEISSLHI